MSQSTPGREQPESEPLTVEPTVAWVVAPNPGPLTLDGTRSYRVGHSRVAVIDPGPEVAGQLDRLRALVGDRTVEAVCLTHAHADHAGIAREAAGEFGAPVAGSATTLRRCGLKGMELAGGDSIPLDDGALTLKVLAAPGHSADHLVYALEPSRDLFTGDLVLGVGSSVILYPDGDVGDCLATFDRLLALRPGWLYPGHGPPVNNGVGRLAECKEHRLARHAQVVASVQAGGSSVRDLRKAVYGGDLAPRLADAADASIRAHLAWMRETGEHVPAIDGFEDGTKGHMSAGVDP